MEQFLTEVREYAALKGILPSTVLQKGAELSGTTWDKWVAGSAVPTMKTVDRLRAFMAANAPAPETPNEDAA